MIDSPCPNPVCNASQMPAPPSRGARVYVICLACHESARAKFYDTPEGVRVEYRRAKNRRHTQVVRLDAELARLLAGRPDRQKLDLDMLREMT